MKPAAALGVILPSTLLVGLVAGMGVLWTALACLGLRGGAVGLLAGTAGALVGTLTLADAWLSLARWRRAPLRVRRALPAAFALGRPALVRVTLENPSDATRRGFLYELADPSFQMAGGPWPFEVRAKQTQRLDIEVVASRRGLKSFSGTQLRIRSPLGLCDLARRLDSPQARRVFPNFEGTGLRWQAVVRTLPEGLKAVRRRGTGTDFDQLVDYHPGDPVRHIDWKATMTHHRPIARQFRDDRDQRLMFLVDCGSRMRADDSQLGVGAAHFDHALNALMTLAFVALGAGDAVGATTFGTPPGRSVRYAPRKGRHSIHALMAALGDVEPTPTFSDYAAGTVALMHLQHRRALVVIITNCRDEDASELVAAARVMRSRHRVVIAMLREQVVARIADQPLTAPAIGLEVAAALDYDERRRKMLRHLAGLGLVVIDCEPPRLGIELINVYTSLKRAGAV